MIDLVVSTPNENSRIIINDILGARRGRVLDIEDQSSRFGHHESHRTTVKGVIPV